MLVNAVVAEHACTEPLLLELLCLHAVPATAFNVFPQLCCKGQTKKQSVHLRACQAKDSGCSSSTITGACTENTCVVCLVFKDLDYVRITHLSSRYIVAERFVFLL